MEKQKKNYSAAEVELILFEIPDIVTASGGGGLNDSDPNDWGDWTGL